MRLRRRSHAATAPPRTGQHRWLAAVVVITVLVAMAVWIGIELSDWPPPPPSAAR